MTSTLQQLFGVSSELKNYHLRIFVDESAGKYFDILDEHQIDMEILYERNSPKIKGYLSIKDFIDFNSQIDFTKVKLEVYMEDVFDNHYTRRFNILNSKENNDNLSVKTMTFNIQDDISFKLQNIFISKAFSSSKVSAFKEFVSEYKIDELLKNCNLKETYEDDGDNIPFTIYRNTNVLDFFNAEFDRLGYNFFQDRFGINIIKRENLLPSKLEIESDIFVDQDSNQLYKNRIFDIESVLVDREKMNEVGKTKVLYYDYKTKKVNEYKDENYHSETTLNTNTSDVRDTIGTRVVYQNRKDEAGYKSQIQENLLKMSQYKIVVNGYIYRNINKIIELKLAGNKAYTDGVVNGNTAPSGKYLVAGVIDKMMGGKLVQKLNLYRSDLQKN